MSLNDGTETAVLQGSAGKKIAPMRKGENPFGSRTLERGGQSEKMNNLLP